MRKLVSALDACVADVADFFGVEEFPLFVMELVVEVDNELGVDEIEKGIANITIILKDSEK